MSGRLHTGARLGALSLALALVSCVPAPEAPAPATPVTAYLGRDAAGEGFARALEPGGLAFPAAHGAHPAYRTEWWYFTGNLQGAGGRHFGFQLTFFRFALSPAAPARASQWAANQVWMAHFALTDTASERHEAHERFSRGALELAGAQTAPFRVWLDDWEAAATGHAFLPLRLRAAAGSAALDLELAPGKPLVLQGEGGLDRKGPEPGNASYYYSQTRLPASGRVRVGTAWLPVTGQAWLDHEWSTSALGADLEGWDWFALQLDDGAELMFYRLRTRAGATSPFSAGRWVNADGSSEPLAPGEVELAPLGTWRSPDSGVRYPVRWRLAIPRRGLALTVTPRIEAQEMRLAVRYWEGAVVARGESADGAVTGQGYLELTGY